MKLLFLTQVLDADDAVLGFVVRWIQGLARHFEEVRVIALEVGETRGLPDNASWREVGRRGVVGRYLRYRRHLSEALGREGFGAVLAHMVPRYALIAARPARRSGAGLYLWYTHKGVDDRLRRAVAAVDRAFTASAESLRVEAPSKLVTGHGIDLAHFESTREPTYPPSLLTVGRLTPAKDPLTVLAAVSILVSRGHDVRLAIAGDALARGDDATVRSVREQIEVGGLAGRVELLGEVPYPEIPRAFERSSVLLSASRTGSVDKVVLEAMACRRPVVTCNESFPPIFAELGERADDLVFPHGDAGALADRVETLLALDARQRADLGARLRGIVERDHEVDRLMACLAREMGAV